MIRRLALIVFALCSVWLLSTPTFAQNGTSFVPERGTDYEFIEGGQPYRPLQGKIEVVEVFGYWCIHCAHFQPQVDAWTRRLPKDVRFTYVPAVFEDNDPFARAYFAAERTGALGRTHDAMFDAVHVSQSLAKNPTLDELADFYATQGYAAAKMKAAMQAPAIAGQLAYAKAFALRSGVTGTPMLVIDGKYRVEGRTAEDRLRIADALIAMERRHER